MSELHPRCRVKDCTAEPTHVLLMHSYTWARTAVQADQAPNVGVSQYEHRKPSPYYCQHHAQERAAAVASAKNPQENSHA